MTRIAINGLGRIGRAVCKQLVEDGALELVAVNDLASADELAYLLEHDSVYGRYERGVRVENGRLVINGRSCASLSEEALEKLPWRDLAVDVVLECTGVFTRQADLERHVGAGARYVILSAPAEGAGRTHRRPRRQPPERRGQHHLVRQLHDQLHHPRDRDPRSPARCPEGDHDHDPRVHGEPGAGGPA
jgi:glyceraldehyde-3-phosphate dehydrogenase/erythrose-4-phosphate dehydrogenase